LGGDTELGEKEEGKNAVLCVYLFICNGKRIKMLQQPTKEEMVILTG